MLGGNELEIHRVYNRPNLPRSLARTEQVGLYLVDNDRDRVSVDQTHVGEEHGHENGAPDQLIKGHLHGNVLGFGAFNLTVEPVVEVVARGAVVDEPEDGEGDQAPDIQRSTCNEKLEG